MNWRTWIIDGYETDNRARADGTSEMRPKFRDGATVEQVDRLEAALTIHLPKSLRSLLQESNGVDLEMHCQGEWFEFLTLVWSCDEIIEKNRSIRAETDAPTAPNEDVTPIFFTNPGVDGILLAFFMHRSGIDDPAVYAYYPIGQEWHLVSPSLEANVLGYVL
jgi:hypothetical protein